jgi:hypothetical protein
MKRPLLGACLLMSLSFGCGGLLALGEASLPPPEQEASFEEAPADPVANAPPPVVLVDGGRACPDRKTVICHRPPDNVGNAHELCITEAAEPEHIAHGDLLGACPDAGTPTAPGNSGNAPGRTLPDGGTRDNNSGNGGGGGGNSGPGSEAPDAGQQP